MLDPYLHTGNACRQGQSSIWFRWICYSPEIMNFQDFKGIGGIVGITCKNKSAMVRWPLTEQCTAEMKRDEQQANYFINHIKCKITDPVDIS